MTGTSTDSHMALMKWFLFGCLGLSLTVRPCTPIAAIPVDASFLQNSTVSSTSGNTRILQVTGTLTAETTAERMAHALSGQARSAAPMPPLSEKSFGQPMLMSMPATSRSLTATIERLSELRRAYKRQVGRHTYTIRAAAAARSGSLVPICRTTNGFSRGHVRNTTVASLLSMKSTLCSVSGNIHEKTEEIRSISNGRRTGPTFSQFLLTVFFSIASDQPVVDQLFGVHDVRPVLQRQQTHRQSVYPDHRRQHDFVAVAQSFAVFHADHVKNTRHVTTNGNTMGFSFQSTWHTSAGTTPRYDFKI